MRKLALIVLALSATSLRASEGQTWVQLITQGKLSSCLSVDAGYLWSAINRLAPLENKTNHVLMLALFHNFST